MMIFKALLAAFGGLALAILAVAFVRWNIDIGSWPNEARGATLMVGLLVMFALVPLLFQKEMGL